jgi:hypothetical protein
LNDDIILKLMDPTYDTWKGVAISDYPELYQEELRNKLGELRKHAVMFLMRNGRADEVPERCEFLICRRRMRERLIGFGGLDRNMYFAEFGGRGGW